MRNKFNGYYFKHQKNGKTVSFIPGISAGGAFIQVITNSESYRFDFPTMTTDDAITIGGCTFSTNGINIHLPNITGKINYSGITPLHSDIMGVFKYFPMECRHGVTSMRHTLTGALTINGDTLDFDGGIGYIERDSGTSFPKSYLWLQCNDFSDDCSVMVSVAEIPFMGLTFQGCICAVIYDQKEYRLATYHGVKVVLDDNRIILSQGKLRLEIEYESGGGGHPLSSPVMGKMSGIIHENNSVCAKLKFYQSDKLIFKQSSKYVSFERFNM